MVGLAQGFGSVTEEVGVTPHPRGEEACRDVCVCGGGQASSRKGESRGHPQNRDPLAEGLGVCRRAEGSWCSLTLPRLPELLPRGSWIT